MAICSDAVNCSSSTIFKECYVENNFRDDVFFCDCSNWFGWVGENCNEPTATLYFFGITYVVFLFWTLFNLVTLGRVLLILVAENKFKAQDINPVCFVALFAFLSSLCILIRLFGRSKAIYDPTFFEVIDTPSIFFSGSNVQRKFHSPFTIIFSAGWILQGLSCLYMIVSWLDVINSINHIFPLKTAVSDRSLKIIISSTMIFICLAFFILASLNAVVEIVFGYTIASFILAFGFSIGYFRFRTRMETLVGGNLGPIQKRAIILVRSAFRINTVCFIGVFIFSQVYYYGKLNHLKILKIGGFNYFLLLLHIAHSFAYATTTYASYYSFRVTKRITSLSENATWIPFVANCRNHFTSLN